MDSRFRAPLSGIIFEHSWLCATRNGTTLWLVIPAQAGI
jgi:hypothetical protein